MTKISPVTSEAHERKPTLTLGTLIGNFEFEKRNLKLRNSNLEFHALVLLTERWKRCLDKSGVIVGEEEDEPFNYI